MKQDRQTIEARRASILSMIRKYQSMKVEELAAQFGVSLMTIRRDLQTLEQAGLIGRFYGGASVDPLSPQDEVLLCRDLISRRAATLVGSGERLFINGSATALGMLDYLDQTPVSVFTNNGLAIGRSFPDGVEITLSGGIVRREGHILTGDGAMRNLLMTRADKAFLGCSGVSPNGEILCDIPAELGISETMIRHASRYYILADHTKIGKGGSSASFSLETAGTLITDERAPEEVLAHLRTLGMQVIQAPFPSAA